MSLLFLDGFDHYDTGRILQKWTGTGSLFAASLQHPGRFAYGGMWEAGGASDGGYIYRGIPPTASVVMGAAFKISGPAQVDLLHALAAWNTDQVKVFVDQLGRLHLWSSLNFDFASNGNVFNFNNWHYLELKCTIDNGAAGSVAVRLDGEPVPGLADHVGLRTSTDGSNVTNGMALLGTGSIQIQDVDDVYLCDQGGGHNNDFLGPIRVQALFPTADATYEQWAMNPDQGAGGHWKNVNQNPPDDDATFNSDGTPGDRDSFTYGPLVGAPNQIKGVQLVAYARKDDAAVRQIATFVRGGGVNYDGPAETISDTYRFYCDDRDINPATGNPWTPAEVNALEAGYLEVT